MKPTYLRSLAVGLMILCLWACQSEAPSGTPMKVNIPPQEAAALPLIKLSKEGLYDKILGMLVGSAIGDAMGAPTEMWARSNIRLEYGFVDSLDDMVREPSAEGTWAMNLAAGGTTDDTRWKVFLGEYLLQQRQGLYHKDGPDPYAFSRFITDRYQDEITRLKQTDSFDPQPIEQQIRRMAWLQEWAIVAQAFKEKDLEAYAYALSRFYGGEMTCAGMLYSPMIGLAYPAAPALAYDASFRLGIFDLGYARDISAITAVMVSAAFDPHADQHSIMESLKTDPEGYFESRLVGRSSYRTYRDALYIVNEAKSLSMEEIKLKNIKLPIKDRDTLYAAQMQKAFELLDQKNQDMPFHAGEIHLINLSALLFGEMDFRKCLEFVINYGRDNDTVGAITGAILGAYLGKDQLPASMVSTILQTNAEQLGLDLEQLATELTEMMIQEGVVDAS